MYIIARYLRNGILDSAMKASKTERGNLVMQFDEVSFLLWLNGTRFLIFKTKVILTVDPTAILPFY